MAKAATQAPLRAPSKPAEAGKKRKGGEIDDIFAAAKKPKLPAAAAGAEGGEAGVVEGGVADEQKGKKGKKAAAGAAEGAAAKPSRTDEAVEEDAAPKRIPETVVDTSKTIETYKPPPLARKQLGENATEEEKRAAEEEERFMDSRGNRKRTEDGLPIYSEAELKIGFGGDTPLCPFDCDCCY
ncbi:hypothetical protein JCM10296v2_005205 [Rhodotorula toruloides]